MGLSNEIKVSTKAEIPWWVYVVIAGTGLAVVASYALK